MGLDLIYTCSNHQLGIRFSSADWQTIAQLRTHLPDDISALFDVPDLGEEIVVDRILLKKAVQNIIDLLREQPNLLPFTYQFKPEYVLVGPPENDNRFYYNRFGTGGLSGIKLSDDDTHRYMIEAGLDELSLEKIAIQPDGTGLVVEVLDIRQEHELQTENCGLIKFRKRREKTSFRKTLTEIHKFFASVQDSEVIKIIT